MFVITNSNRRTSDFQTDPECVNFEFDSSWSMEAGVSALGCMEKFRDRMKLWHINYRGTWVKGAPMTSILTWDSMELGGKHGF